MRDTTAKKWAAGFRRVRLTVGHTLGALLAMRVTLLLGLGGVGFLLLTRWLGTFNFGAEELRFVGDFGLGALGFFGAGLAALATAQVFFQGLGDGTAAVVLTRPGRRTEYLAGVLGGVLAMLALFTVAVGGLLAGLLAWRASELGVAVPPVSGLGAAVAMQGLKLGLVAAMTLLVCTYASSVLFAAGLGLLLTVIGHWRLVAGQGDGLAWLAVWPDLTRFAHDGWWMAGATLDGGALASLGGYWLAWMGLSGGLAVYVFQHREF
jgi:hypothetical protein